MRNFISLFKVFALSSLGINKTLHSKKKGSGLLFLVVIGLLLCAGIIAYGYFYADTFAKILIAQGQIEKLVPCMIAVSALIAFFYSFYAIGSVLFSAKDYDMLASMPVGRSTIVFSKLAFTYVTDLALCILLGAPAFYVYLTYSSVDFGVCFRLIIAVIFSPVLPIALSIVISTAISYFSTLFRRKNLIQTILLIVVLCGVFIASFLMTDENLLLGLGVVEKIYFLFPFLVGSIFSYLELLIYLAISIGAFAVVIIPVILFYNQINTALLSKRTLKNFKLKEQSVSGQFSCLYKKELKKLFSLPMYVVNSVMGMAFSLVVSVILLVSVNSIDLGQGGAELLKVFVCFAPTLLAMFFMTAPTTACSISLEGKSFWFIQSAPIKFNQLINAKILLNLTFCLPSAIVCAILLSVGLYLEVTTSLLLVLLSILIAIVGGNLGMIFNLLLPKFNWKTPNDVIKRGGATALTTLGGIIISGLLAVFAVLFIINPDRIDRLTIYLIICAGIFLVLSVATYLFIIKKGERVLTNKIE